MSIINQPQIVNNSNSKGLKFHYTRNVNQSITFKNVDIGATGDTANNNFVANFGFGKVHTVDFVLRDDGTDKSTDGSNKVTLREQINHLFDPDGVIQGTGGTDSTFEVTFTLTTYKNGTTDTVTGVLEDISINENTSSPIAVSGTLSLKEGTN